MATERKLIKRVGRVKSDRMAKTISVVVERRVMHPVYKKYVRRFTTFMAHDENEEARVGDRVEIVFTRPLSKRKRWRLVRIVEAGAPADEFEGTEEVLDTAGARRTGGGA